MAKNDTQNFSVIIPAKNEADSLQPLITRIKDLYQNVEVIVVNDGSTDNTGDIATEYADVHIHHPLSLGNGAAIKNGARNASYDILLFMDADGQHNPDNIKDLLDAISNGYDMAIGTRTAKAHASIARLIANNLYNTFASIMTGRKIKDLTSGFRAVRRSKFIEFLTLLPNGFSYPTTITMAFIRSGYQIGFVDTPVYKRIGKSHISPLKDGVRFLLIIFKVSTLYSPLKLFAPVALSFLTLGLAHYSYTFITSGRFTNMSALLLITSVLVFLIGLVSEQITQLLYAGTNKNNR